MRLNRHEHETMDALDRYWDAVVTGEESDDAGLEPAIAAAVRAVHERDDAPAPDPTFLARLGRQLETADAARMGRPGAATREDAPGGYELMPERGVAAVWPEPGQRGWRRWARESAGMAAAAVVLVAVAGLLVVLLQGRGEGQGIGPGGASSLVATSADFTVSLSSQGRDGDRLMLTLEIVPTDPEAMPDLKALGEFPGWRPGSDGHLDGLADPLGRPKWIFPMEETVREGGRWDSIFTGYRVGLSLQMLRDPDQPVSITITRLVFLQPDGSEREFTGEWRFTFVPADIAEEVPVPGLEAIDPVLATLREAGLVVDIGEHYAPTSDSQWPAGEYTLDWVAFDRDVTYVGYSSDQRVVVTLLTSDGFPVDEVLDARIAMLRDGAGDDPILGSVWWTFSGLDPATDQVRVMMRPEPNLATQGTTREPIEMFAATRDVDLSPLADLPEPQSLQASATANGVAIDAVDLRRGIAVSTLTLRATVQDPDAVIPMILSGANSSGDIQDLPMLWHHGLFPAVSATVDGKPVTVIGQGDNRGNGVQDTRSIRLANLPERGTLRLSIPWWWVAVDKSEQDLLIGPWELTIDLETGAAG